MFIKKNLVKINFGLIKFLVKKIFGQDFSWSNKIFGKKNVGQKKFGQKNSLEVFFGDGCSCSCSCDKVTQSKL